jgi:probable HAF family extracellular repeat protein
MSVAPGAWAQAYTAVGLGTLSGGSTSYPTAINASGQVVGYANTSSGAVHGFLYSSAIMNDLGSLSGDLYSQATGINNSGEIVGFASPSYGSAATYAFVYSGGNMTLLGTLSGDPYSVATAVNSSGQVAGYSSSSGFPSIPAAFLYGGSGSPQSLGTLGGAESAAEGINGVGQVVGWSFTSGAQQHAFLYSGVSMTDLGTLSGGNQSIASAINTSGQIVGFGNTGTASAHAFLYTSGTGMTDLGVISGYVTSVATGINSGGQIVGYSTPSVGIPHAFLYSNATMTDLNSLVSNLPSGVYLEYATAINDSGQIVAQANNNLAYLLTPNTTTTPLQLIPVAPCRIMDTRYPDAPLGGPTIPAGATRTIPVPSSSCGIPSSAAAYSLNVTVVPRAGVLNYLTVWPTGQSQPVVSTLNSLDGEILANAAIVPAGTGGSIEAFATDETDLVIDINGYFVPPTTGSLQFYPLTPCRILDTRKTPNGTFAGPSLASGSSRSFPIQSSGCNVPGTAAAYAFNVTVVPPLDGVLAYLTVWPTGESRPVVSTLNSLDGNILANAAIVPAGSGGAVSFYATNTTDLVVDINGYFAAPAAGGLNFYAVPPCRIVDTRKADGTFAGPIMGASTTRAFPLSQGPCGISDSAAAYSLNMTVVPSGYLGYLTLWPTGDAQPVVSTLNALEGQLVANAALVPAGTGGAVNVFVTNATHVVIDTNGYFQ